ncbi:MAG: hypothetical protein KAW13_02470 [Dehalococcoidia bacterium]|nr:hypothetical protein [Dehalococcoidia bacterium]
MAKYEEHHEQVIKAHTGVEAIYSEATFTRIAEDAVFFRRKAGEDNIDDSERKRYSRIAILLMAFYLESLSNLLCDVVLGKNRRRPKKNKEEGVPGPIRRVRAVYKELYDGKELALNIDGVQDVFTIRNKVIAHPAGRSEERSGKVVRTRVDKTVSYKKFTDFPFTYSQFTLSHAEEVLEEVKDFLTRFHDLLKDRRHEVPKDVLNACFPRELVEWSKEVAKH